MALRKDFEAKMGYLRRPYAMTPQRNNVNAIYIISLDIIYCVNVISDILRKEIF